MGLSLFSKRKRPLHLGAYPMEKIKRVEKTTTLIIDDAVGDAAEEFHLKRIEISRHAIG